MESSHCCHADFHESAAALSRKAQGFEHFFVRNLAPEQSQGTLNALLSRLTALFRTQDDPIFQDPLSEGRESL